MTREEIIQRLSAVDEELEKYSDKIKGDLSLIMVRGASVIVRYNLDRSTQDIDVLSTGLKGRGIGSLLEKYGFHVVSDVVVNLHPDFEKRLQGERMRNFTVFYLDPLDLSISKISRGFEKDMDDIFNSDLVKALEPDRLKRLYFEAMEYWIGDKKTFEDNWHRFERRYHEYKSS